MVSAMAPGHAHSCVFGQLSDLACRPASRVHAPRGSRHCTVQSALRTEQVVKRINKVRCVARAWPRHSQLGEICVIPETCPRHVR